MTLDEALARSARHIDAILEQRRDEMALQMIACGMDPTEQLPEPSDEDGPWSRVSLEWVLQEQRRRDDVWRDQTLADLRVWLLQEFGSTK